MQNMVTDDKSGILYRKWQVVSPRAVVLLVHGMGAHSLRWQFLAEYFIKKNISSYAIELKGFGETSDRKGHIASFRTYYEDIAALQQIAADENPGVRVFLTGESMGALISFIDAFLEPDLFDGLICISPVFRSRLKFGILNYFKIGVFSLIFPKKQIHMPFTSSMCTRDEDYRKAMDPDEREHRLATPGLLREISCAQIRSRAAAKRMNMPVLFLLAGEDKLVDPAASKKVFKEIISEDKKLIEYPGMYHALSIEEGREKVFDDMDKWIAERTQNE